MFAVCAEMEERRDDVSHDVSHGAVTVREIDGSRSESFIPKSMERSGVGRGGASGSVARLRRRLQLRLRFQISAQARKPAEFKHIIKRRKRNEPGFPQ